MSANDKSRAVFTNTFYHFADKCPTFKVGPSLKNTMAFSREGRHSRFVEKYATLYTANKNHAKFNLLTWLRMFDNEHHLQNIKKKNYDDAADAFLTIFGFVVTKKPFD